MEILIAVASIAIGLYCVIIGGVAIVNGVKSLLGLGKKSSES